MKDRIQSLLMRLRLWMYDRYGLDAFSKAMIVLSLACSIFTGLFKHSFLLDLAAFLLFTYAVYRCCSKNITARRAELAKYDQFAQKVRRSLSKQQHMWADRKTHRYYNCPKCGTTLRVPKGKGKIRISCPNCKHEMIKKT